MFSSAETITANPARTCRSTHVRTYSTAQMQSITNAFERSPKRVCAFGEMRLRVHQNAFARSTKRVCAFNKTRLSGPNERVRMM